MLKKFILTVLLSFGLFGILSAADVGQAEAEFQKAYEIHDGVDRYFFVDTDSITSDGNYLYYNYNVTRDDVDGVWLHMRGAFWYENGVLMESSYFLDCKDGNNSWTTDTTASDAGLGIHDWMVANGYVTN